MKAYKFKINGEEYSVQVNGIKDGIAEVVVGESTFEVELDQPEKKNAEAAPVAAVTAPAASKSTGKSIKSPLPGIVVEVCVQEGQAVKSGQKVAVLEAMKMENEIQAESDGVVSKVHVKPGDTVQEGADIVTL